MEWYHYLLIALGSVAVLLAIVVLVAFLYVRREMYKNFGTHAEKRPGSHSQNKALLGDEYDEAWKYGEVQCKQFFALPYDNISVKTDDGLTLRGKFYKSLNKDAKATLICVHGFRGSPEWDFGTLCMFFVSNYNVIYTNHRAHNDSEGNTIALGVKEWEDIKLWIKKAQELTPECNIILHGVSMGGATVLSACNEEICSKVSFIVADCGFTSAEKQLEHIVRGMRVPLFPAFNFCRYWFERVAKVKLSSKTALDAVKNSKAPILFIHGKKDKFVPIEMGRQLYEACSSEKDCLWVDGAGHGSSYFINRKAYEEKYAQFTERYCK